MDILKASGVALILLGLLGLGFGSFSYYREPHAAKVASMEVTAGQRRSVDVPVWAGVAAIVIGGMLLLSRRQ